jgi:hypothetical protein
VQSGCCSMDHQQERDVVTGILATVNIGMYGWLLPG